MASEAKEIVGFRPTKSGLQPLDAAHDAALTAQALAEIDRGDFLSEAAMDRVFDAVLADLPSE